MELSKSSELFRRTRWRLRLAAAGRGGFVAFLVLCGMYAAVLLAGRLLGVVPDGFHLLTLAAIPLAAVVAGLLFHRRATDVEAARAIDRAGGTKDLFLTVALLDDAPGEFKPLVTHDAEQRAAGIRPAEVVPFHWQRRCVQAAALLMLLAAGVLWLPQWDPFGKVAAAEKIDKQRQQLADSRRATQARMAQLRSDRDADRKDVEQAIEDLKTAFNQMQPQAKEANLQRIFQQQKPLGEKWRENAEKLKELMSQKSSSQQFGGANREKLEKWTQDLQRGSADSLRKEIDDLRDQLQRLSKTDDPAKRDEMARQLRKRLQELADFAREKTNSKPLAAAVERAMEQLAASGLDGLSTEGLEALAESLDLSKMELEELAQSIEDLQQLEQALKTLQMARRLNEFEMLDGEACQGCEGLGDYEELYARLMARCQGEGEGDGDGGAFGGRGIGRGGIAPEDDSAETAFKPERSRSAITAGKTLLTLKTQALGDPAEARLQYRDQLREVRQGYSEAILQERIPPGYHEGIQKYFDNLDEALVPAEQP